MLLSIAAGLAMVDATVSLATARSGRTSAVAGHRSRAGAWALSAAAMLAVLMAPVLWNGFPLIFPDTGGYLTRPIEGTLLFGRSAFYGLFLYLGLPLSFWPIAVAQSAMMAWLIVLALRAHGLGGRPWLTLGTVMALAAGTSLPWMTGELLPDIFFPAAVLALDLLIFRYGRLLDWERYTLGAVMACAIMGHMAAAALCVALVAALWLLTRFVRRALPPARLKFAAGAVAAGIALCPLSNWAITGSFAFTPGGTGFLFARMLEDGIVGRYLGERCPDPAFHLCDYKSNLAADADDWLWGADSPFYKLDESVRTREERAVILATLARYPLMHLRAAIDETLEQLQSFQTEVSLTDNAPTISAFADYAPRLMPQFMSARQQTGAIDVPMLNMVHVPVAVLAMALVAGGVIFGRTLQLRPAVRALCATVLLSLFFNAAICAVFSHSVDRYQSRLMPLALLAVLLLLAGRWLRLRRHRLGAPADLP
jgi:hypothetical protein